MLEIIIVNYRCAGETVRTLGVLLPQLTQLSARVTVVDNDSRDDSIAVLSSWIRNTHSEPSIELLPSNHNGGFGAGNNLAIRRALLRRPAPEWFLLLNPDARPKPGALPKLLLQARQGTQGVLGCRIESEAGELQGTSFRFPSPLGELETSLRLRLASRLLSRWAIAPSSPPGVVAADWVSGACMLIHRDVFETVGLFDETFFLYFEEVDLCRRAKLGGFPVLFTSEATIAHRGCVSTKLNRENTPLPDYWWKSRRYYFLKHAGWPNWMAANALRMAGVLLWRARRWIQGRPELDPPRFLRGLLRHAGSPPGFAWARLRQS